MQVNTRPSAIDINEYANADASVIGTFTTTSTNLSQGTDIDDSGFGQFEQVLKRVSRRRLPVGENVRDAIESLRG